MAYTIVQGGTSLYALNSAGQFAVVPLPSGVTVGSNRPRFIVSGNYAIYVNAPSRPVTIDANLVARVLTPRPPTTTPTLAGVSGGALSGMFQVRQTFYIKDGFGNVIAESDFGPTSLAATISSQFLQVSNLDLSQDNVSGTRIYRTTSGTSVFFKWLEMEGNTQTSFQDDLSDAGISTISAPSLGSAPDLTLVAEFRGRLFGVARSTPDTLNYTQTGFNYAWPGANKFVMPRQGSDAVGITGLAPRRDALGIGRENAFFQLTGTDDTNFRIVKVSENVGITAPDSVAIYRDTAWFLWRDGVYQWDANGILCITDGKVRRWFTRGDTFNLARFPYAFSQIDPFRRKYRLFLASANANSENCWIEYDWMSKTWWGPHTSAAMNPAASFSVVNEAGLAIPSWGATDGFIRQEQATRSDDQTGIDFDIVTNRDSAGMPDDEKYFGEMSLSLTPQTAGTLVVQSAVGELDALRFTKTFDTADLALSRARLQRIGLGKAFKLRFRNKEKAQDVNLRGYEIDPVYRVGKR